MGKSKWNGSVSNAHITKLEGLHQIYIQFATSYLSEYKLLFAVHINCSQIKKQISGTEIISSNVVILLILTLIDVLLPFYHCVPDFHKHNLTQYLCLYFIV